MGEPRMSDTKPEGLSILGDKIHFKHANRFAPNRFLKSAMTEKISTWDEKVETNRGIPTPELIRIYEAWGKGGFGVIISGNTFGDYVNLEAKGNAIMRGNEPERIEGFKKMSAASKADGAIYITQLSHGGRQTPAECNPYPVSASDVRLVKMSGQETGEAFGQPTQLTKENIKEVVTNFANAAKYAYDTGSDGVQFHCAHGYLLAQFLAPSTNKRTDEYGGNLDNRSRILREILTATRQVVPDPSFILGVKINSVEFSEGGFTTEECRDVCAKLEQEHGVDLIELSGGTYEELAFSHKKESTKARESFFLDFSEIVRSSLKDATVWVTGGFRTAKAMVDAIQSGATQGIGLARPVTGEPDLPKKILAGQVYSARKCVLDDYNFAQLLALCVHQMKQLGQGVTPIDGTKEQEVMPILKEAGLA